MMGSEKEMAAERATQEAMEVVSKALDARNDFVRENGPSDPGYREKLEDLEKALSEANSHWEQSMR
jgi:hypothetical protein